MTQDPFYEPDPPVYQAQPIEEKPEKNKTVIIIIIVAVVLFLCCACLIAAWFLGDSVVAIFNEVMYDMGLTLVALPIG